MINAHKSAADSEALRAIASFYSGLAFEESVDVTKLLDSTAAADLKNAEAAKLQQASDFYKKAQESFELAARDCAQFRAQFKSPEELALFDRDIQGYHNLAKLMASMVGDVQAKMMPKIETTHAAMDAIAEMLAYAKYRAQAHRGMEGHYPKDGLHF